MQLLHFPEVLQVKGKGDRRSYAILEGPSETEQPGRSKKLKKTTDSLRVRNSSAFGLRGGGALPAAPLHPPGNPNCPGKNPATNLVDC